MRPCGQSKSIAFSHLSRLHALNSIINRRHHSSPNDAQITIDQPKRQVVVFVQVLLAAQPLSQTVKLSTNTSGDFPIVEGEAKAVLGLQSLIEDRPVVIAGQE